MPKRRYFWRILVNVPGACRSPGAFFAVALLLVTAGGGGVRLSVAAETLVLSAEEYAHISRHDPADAEYQPGVDARGRAVASADLDTHRMWTCPTTSPST